MSREQASIYVDIPREYLSKSQLADYLGVSARTINAWMGLGLPHYRAGSKILKFRRTEVDVWFEQQFKADPPETVDRIVDEVMRSIG